MSDINTHLVNGGHERRDPLVGAALHRLEVDRRLLLYRQLLPDGGQVAALQNADEVTLSCQQSGQQTCLPEHSAVHAVQDDSGASHK